VNTGMTHTERVREKYTYRTKIFIILFIKQRRVAWSLHTVLINIIDKQLIVEMIEKIIFIAPPLVVYTE